MELLQLSTSWCPPCKKAKEYIETNFDPDYINYKFVLLDQDNGYPEYDEIVAFLKPRSVPLFAVVDNNEVIYTFNGFNIKEIQKYVDYIIKQKTTAIRDSINDKTLKDNAEMMKNIVRDLSQDDNPPNKTNGQIDDYEDYDGIDE